MNEQDPKLQGAKDDPKVTEKKEHTFELRDLKPMKDVKGGAAKPKPTDKRMHNRTVEVDFMGWE